MSNGVWTNEGMSEAEYADFKKLVREAVMEELGPVVDRIATNAALAEKRRRREAIQSRREREETVKATRRRRRGV